MIYSIKNRFLTVQIKSIGAELQSIKKDNIEYLWQGDENSWKNRATNIFPYIGRTKNGKYTFKGNVYEMGSHGFARNTEFSSLKESEEKIIFKIESSEKTLKCYPFNFEFFIIYELKENNINISFKVINKDEKTMYFGVGGHPGFIVPIEKDLYFEDYYLEFYEKSKPKRINTSTNCLVLNESYYRLENDNILRLKNDIFDDDAIILNNVCKSVTLKSDKSDRKIFISYPDMNYLALWQTPKKSPNFICIEPWTSTPSRDDRIEDLESQENLVSLGSKKEYINNWSISIY